MPLALLRQRTSSNDIGRSIARWGGHFCGALSPANFTVSAILIFPLRRNVHISMEGMLLMKLVGA